MDSALTQCGMHLNQTHVENFHLELVQSTKGCDVSSKWKCLFFS